MNRVGALLERPLQTSGRHVEGVSGSAVVCSVASLLRSTARSCSTSNLFLASLRWLRSARSFVQRHCPGQLAFCRSQVNVALECAGRFSDA
jgi:hypothetical protein